MSQATQSPSTGAPSSSQGARSHMGTIKWMGMLCAAALVAFGLHSLGYEYSVVAFSAITTIALCCWALELLPDALVGVALPIMYIVFEVAPAQKVLAPWTGFVGWFVFGGMLVGMMLMKVGLSRRLALYCVNLVGRNFLLLMFGLLLTGTILAMFVPSTMGRAAVLAVLSVGICEALNLEKGSREAATIILAGFMSTSAPTFGFLSGGADVVIMMDYLSKLEGGSLSWMEFAVQNFIPCLVYSIVSILCVYFVMRPNLKGDMRQYVRPQLEALGPMSLAEKKTGALVFILLILLVTDQYHGIPISWLMLLVPCLAFTPILGIMNNDDFKRINFPVIMFTVGCLTIGSTATACGMGKVVSAALLPVMDGSEFYTISMTYIAGALLNFVFTPLAALGALTPSLIEIANSLAYSPNKIMYAFGYGLNQFLFPYEYSIMVYFYAFGYVTMRHILSVFSVRMVLGLLVVMFVAYPYWNLVM